MIVIRLALGFRQLTFGGISLVSLKLELKKVIKLTVFQHFTDQTIHNC